MNATENCFQYLLSFFYLMLILFDNINIIWNKKSKHEKSVSNQVLFLLIYINLFFYPIVNISKEVILCATHFNHAFVPIFFLFF